MASELLSLIFIDGMADVRIGALDGDFASSGWKDGGCLLLELDIELYFALISITLEMHINTDLDPVLKLYFARGVYADIFECFSSSIIRGFAAALQSTDDCRFWDSSG